MCIRDSSATGARNSSLGDGAFGGGAGHSGIRSAVILALPNVISFDTLTALAAA